MKQRLLGNRVGIKLEEYSTPDSGIINPLYVQGTTDGGKPVSMLDDFPLAPIGTVVEIAAGAKENLSNLGMGELKVGDKVTIQRHAISFGNYWFQNPQYKVVDITDEDERHIAINPINIISTIEE